MFPLVKKIKKLFYLTFVGSVFFASSNNFIFALENNSIKKNLQKTQEINLDLNLKKNYLLGVGDKLLIEFSGLPIFTNLYSVDPQGFLTLPEINKIYAANKTIEELHKLLMVKYQEYIFNPQISLKVVFYRPVNVFIKGEVKTPGLYKLYYSNQDKNIRENQFKTRIGNISSLPPTTIEKRFNVDKFNFESNTYYPPKLFDALRESRGITNYADLSNIRIIRKNSESQGGGKIATNIDFLKLLKDGDQDYNIDINDGDIIIVGKSTNVLKDQILSINKTNFTPNQIRVYVSGNVEEPGPIILEQGSSLIQAIYSAGGEKYFTGEINHIRFNEKSKVRRKSFSFNSNAPINTKQNPILLDGDIITVKKTVLGKVASALKEASGPILTTTALINLID